jgi:hypothetical protein
VTPHECFEYLVDCAGDVESENADPELKMDCNKIRSILESVELVSRGDLEACLRRYGDMETTVRNLIQTISECIEEEYYGVNVDKPGGRINKPAERLKWFEEV